MIRSFLKSRVISGFFKNDLAVMFWLLVAMMGMINLKYGNNL